MQHRRFLLSALLTLFFLAGVSAHTKAQDESLAAPEPPDPAHYELERVVGGLRHPVYLTHAGDGSERLFIASKFGDIWVYDDGQLAHFMNVTRLLAGDTHDPGSEVGLHSLAFHPNFAENGYFYVMYSNHQKNSVLERYQISDISPNIADPTTARLIMEVEQPHETHNGGLLKFGADGYLYIGLGDGGGGYDEFENSQNPHTLLGTILRIDVDGGDPYAIPPDNPFFDGVDGAPEVWKYGLRNPWRFSFDRITGDLYIGDVGQERWEEINFLPAGESAANFGWVFYEGTHSLTDNTDPDMDEARARGLRERLGQAPDDLVMPIAEYRHDEGCSVTGGYVYRGERLPEFQNRYLYGDFCSGKIWLAWRDESDVWQNTLFMDTDMVISSFGEDEAGELYIVNYIGSIWQITRLE